MFCSSQTILIATDRHHFVQFILFKPQLVGIEIVSCRNDVFVVMNASFDLVSLGGLDGIRPGLQSE